MTRPKSNQSPPPLSSTGSEGYCHSCGRLLPKENKSDPTPRKFCSTTCRSHSKSNIYRNIRKELIESYHKSLSENKMGKVILCSDIEKIVFKHVTVGDDHTEPTIALENGSEDTISSSSSSKLSQVEQREESRRAARRLVAFGFESQGILNENRSLEPIQNGKIVETSFAKGEWGIRWK
ncbi:uncharacterized protein L201_006074 [Kwoniella dendrophila CBS 6074]|uniref:DUF2116 family Zn-ribbon domain-containing protein n=1 Tax=Kwoniella dendrophila CBS 6074 TaxID=1295534 RepID=A0AAX4K1V0_9TREE